MIVILILFIGLFYNKIAGTAYGILLGIFLDFFIGRKVGISAIMLGTVGLIGGIFDKNFSKESRITIILMVIASTIMYEFGTYVIGYFVYDYSFEFLAFVKMILIECVYNALITIIIYPLINALGYKIEGEVKGNKILTRYF